MHHSGLSVKVAPEYDEISFVQRAAENETSYLQDSSTVLPPQEQLAGLDNPHIAKVYPKIWKLPSDNREYLILQLKNGVRIFFITNPETPLGSLAISFESGLYSDPIHLQGLAHFHEHMASMGSKKFPGSKSFREFMDQIGGSGNAETTPHSTTHWQFVPDKYIIELAQR